jgi:hypothetical protein
MGSCRVNINYRLAFASLRALGGLPLKKLTPLVHAEPCCEIAGALPVFCRSLSDCVLPLLSGGGSHPFSRRRKVVQRLR